MAGKNLKEVVSFLSKTETTQSEKIPSKEIDLSMVPEAYAPCPNCGSDHLMFGSYLDFAHPKGKGHFDSVSTIVCSDCCFSNDVCPTASDDEMKKISTHEKNRRIWNSLYEKNKQKN